MPYLQQSDVVPAFIEQKIFDQALDDTGDGTADSGAWDALVAAVSEEADGILASRFDVPFSDADVPPQVKTAVRFGVLEALWLRRGYSPESNPYAAKAALAMKALVKLAESKLPVGPAGAPASAGGRALKAKSKFTPTSGTAL